MALFAFLDLETTGFDYEKGERITEIAIFVADENGKKVRVFDTLVNPERGISFDVQKLTGITPEMVKNSPKFKDLSKNIVEVLSDTVIVAHNAAFDIKFLNASLKGVGLPPLKNKVVDTLKLFKRALPKLENFKLGTVCKFLEITNESAHRAMSDVIAMGRAFFKVKKQENFEKALDESYIGAKKERKKEGEKEEKKVHVYKDLPDSMVEIVSVVYWQMYSHKRVYVESNAGKVFFDLNKKAWDFCNLPNGELIKLKALQKLQMTERELEDFREKKVF